MEGVLRRPRRNRRSAGVRALVQEHVLRKEDLVMPLFVTEGEGISVPISSMPGMARLSPDLLLQECLKLHELGVRAVALFPAIPDSLKNSAATEALNPEGLYPRVIRMLKENIPELVVISDIALDPYNSDGHDGLVNPKTGEIENDSTLEILAQMAELHAKVGVDFVAPSDMMDGRVGFIRNHLDKRGLTHVGILAYSAKYASAFYGPFRDALDSAPKSGDKKTYQMDPSNVKEALLEATLDIEEGADIIMVKPGLPYLDVVRAVSEKSNIPVAVYNVSGEYAMLNAAAKNGWINYKSAVMETLTAFKRAGASMIFTYHAKEVATWLSE